MFAGYSEVVAREKQKDNLRRFEKANLVKQCEPNNNHFNLWQIVKSWLKTFAANQKTTIYKESILTEEMTSAEEMV